MKISTPSSSSRVGTTRRSENTKTGGAKGATEFSRFLSDAMGASPEEVSGLDAPLSTGSVEALLAAQVIGDATDEESRHRMIQHGEDILDRLEELRRGLLSGSLPRERLFELAQLVRNRRNTTDDPKLHSLLDEIELRAEVEIAKLNRQA